MANMYFLLLLYFFNFTITVKFQSFWYNDNWAVIKKLYHENPFSCNFFSQFSELILTLNPTDCACAHTRIHRDTYTTLVTCND